VHETSSDVVTVTELEYSKATSNPVRIVLAVPKEMGVDRGDQLPDGVRVSTEYPELTRRYFDKVGVRARIVPSYGATEAKVPDIVDAIVDVTETGSSLRKHGLKVIETLLTSRTELVANVSAHADEEKREAMNDLALLLQGAIRARGQVLLKLNVAGADLAGVLEVLPSMTSPTVTELAKSDHKAVETVVPKRGVNTLLPRLKSAGATDILELPISKIVE
jgi:ATP phosphoribosyltransferase